MEQVSYLWGGIIGATACSRYILTTVDADTSVMSRNELLETFRSYCCAGLWRKILWETTCLWTALWSGKLKDNQCGRPCVPSAQVIGISDAFKKRPQNVNIWSTAFGTDNSEFFLTVIEKFFLFCTSLCLNAFSVPVLKAKKYSLDNSPKLDFRKSLKWEDRILKIPCLTMILA